MMVPLFHWRFLVARLRRHRRHPKLNPNPDQLGHWAEPSLQIAGPTPTWHRVALGRQVDLSLIGTTSGVELGEVTFLDDGTVALGNLSFASGTEIVNHRMGRCMVNRDYGPGQLLVIDRPDGESFHYAYQHGLWYRLIPLTGKRNIFIQTLSEEIRQQGILAVVSWFRQLVMGIVVLGAALGTAFLIFFFIMVWNQ